MDREKYSDILVDFYTPIFTAAEEFQAPPEFDAVIEGPAFNAIECASAICKIKVAKSPAEDHLVPEMLRPLIESSICMERIKSFFNSVRVSHPVPDRWRTIECKQLPKSKVNQSHMLTNKSRSIAMVPCDMKTYDVLMQSRYQPFFDGLAQNQFGFRSGFQATEASFVLRQIVEKARFWGAHAYIYKCDISKAFDKVSHGGLVAGLRSLGVPDYCTYNVLKMNRCQSFFHVDGINSAPIQRTCSIMQGMSSSSPIYCSVMDLLFVVLKRRWGQMGWALDTLVISHILYADDVTIIAATRTEFELMVQEFRSCLQAFNMTLEHAKSQWCTTSAGLADTADLVIDGLALPMQPHAEGFQFVGHKIAFTGRQQNELKHRTDCAVNKFHAVEKAWKNNRCSWREILPYADKMATSALQYGIGSIRPNRDDIHSLDALQRRLGNKACRLRIRNTETWHMFNKRSKDILGNRFAQLGIRSWTNLYLLRYFQWCGHVARLAPERLAHKLLKCRSQWYLEQVP